jgi:hypothetical protein
MQARQNRLEWQQMAQAVVLDQSFKTNRGITTITQVMDQFECAKSIEPGIHVPGELQRV